MPGLRLGLAGHLVSPREFRHRQFPLVIRILMFESSIHTDTEWPKDPEAKMNEDGLLEPSCECLG